MAFRWSPFVYPDGEARKGIPAKAVPLVVTLRRLPYFITGRNATAGIPYGKQGAVSSELLPIPGRKRSYGNPRHYFSKYLPISGRECPLWHSGGPPLSTPMVESRKAFSARMVSPGSHPPAVSHSITGRNATAAYYYPYLSTILMDIIM